MATSTNNPDKRLRPNPPNVGSGDGGDGSPRDAASRDPEPDDREGSDSRDVRDIMLLCNPRAGGRWKELATILDSPEAQHVRWIVTDSIKDIGPALSSMGEKTRLLCIYGGDGTIQRVLEELFAGRATDATPTLAFIGGGTMNVTAAWCGWSREPGRNFRHVIKAYRAGRLLTKEVPLLAVRQAERTRLGFTFGLGPIVRVLDEYENSRKGISAALEVVAKAVSGAWLKIPRSYHDTLQPLEAEVIVDGERLPYRRFSALFCNTTGRLHIGVEPFVKQRTRDTLYYAAYAITRQEVVLWLPMLARGRLPLDPKAFITPTASWKQMAVALLGEGALPADPRYVNDLAQELEIRSAEPIYTVDAEIVPSTGDPLHVSLGPYLQLAVHPTVDLPATMRLAAEVTPPRRNHR
jgi:diacylglycerol kinase family enzyme